MTVKLTAFTSVVHQHNTGRHNLNHIFCCFTKYHRLGAGVEKFPFTSDFSQSLSDENTQERSLLITN